MVSVYSHKDASYTINERSGFGCHLMATKVGFHADLKANQRLGRGWNQLMSWESRMSVHNGLYGGVGARVFTATKKGYYFCATQVRLDKIARTSYFRLILALNGVTSNNHGDECFGVDYV